VWRQVLMMYQFVVKIEYLMVRAEQTDNRVHELLYDKQFQDDHQQHIDIDYYVLVVHEKPLIKQRKIILKLFSTQSSN
jgi:hypothetical protein